MDAYIHDCVSLSVCISSQPLKRRGGGGICICVDGRINALVSNDLQVMKMCRSAGLCGELQQQITQVTLPNLIAMH